MKPAWQVMKETPSIRTLFLFISANSPFSLLCFLLSPLPFLHLPGRLSSNFGVFSLNGHLYQTQVVLDIKLDTSLLDISIRHTMVAVLVPCILDSGLNV